MDECESLNVFSQQLDCDSSNNRSGNYIRDKQFIIAININYNISTDDILVLED